MNAKCAWCRVIYFAFAILLLAGCSTTGTDVASLQSVPVESIVSNADKALAAGDQEGALSLLNAATKAHPTSPQPWLKKARLFFDAGNYPSAILAAEEALQRDSSNDEAGSIALVSSLRIAVKYVSDLRIQAGLTGNARPDGERLAAKLRETLKEPVLVPPGNQRSLRPRPKPVRPPLKPNDASPQPLSSKPEGSNPFSSLK